MNSPKETPSTPPPTDAQVRDWRDQAEMAASEDELAEAAINCLTLAREVLHLRAVVARVREYAEKQADWDLRGDLQRILEGNADAASL